MNIKYYAKKKEKKGTKNKIRCILLAITLSYIFDVAITISKQDRSRAIYIRICQIKSIKYMESSLMKKDTFMKFLLEKMHKCKNIFLSLWKLRRNYLKRTNK